MAYIEVENLSFRYEIDDVLKNVSFQINAGEWVSIIGHNGSGKSTIARLLVGLIEKHTGSIKIDSLEVNEENIYEIRKKIGIVFQNPDNQFVGTTVIDDMAFGLENLCIEREKMIELIDKYLDKTKMTEFKHKEPHNLSGGQKQRVAVAGILAMQTDIIILDEATSMLDPEGRRDLLTLIRELKQENKTIIYITHDMNEVMYGDKILLLNDGEVLAFGETMEIMKNAELLEKSHLELPKALKIYYELQKDNYKNEKVMDLLWQSVLKR